MGRASKRLSLYGHVRFMLAQASAVLTQQAKLSKTQVGSKSCDLSLIGLYLGRLSRPQVSFGLMGADLPLFLSIPPMNLHDHCCCQETGRCFSSRWHLCRHLSSREVGMRVPQSLLTPSLVPTCTQIYCFKYLPQAKKPSDAEKALNHTVYCSLTLDFEYLRRAAR